MSIRLRLTLLYSAILALTLVLSGIALYAAVSRMTLTSARQALATEAQGYAAAIHLQPDPDRGVVRLDVPLAVRASPDYVQVRRADGTILYRSSPYTLPLGTATQRRAQFGVLSAIVSVNGTRLLLATLPLPSFGTPGQGGPPQNPPGQSPPGRGAPSQATAGHSPPPPGVSGVSGVSGGTVQVASSLQGVDRTLSTLRQALLLGGVIATLLACGAGWALAGTALRPINRITQTAAEIGATQDFDRRVAYAGPPDEVGRLARTVNTMLERLQAAYQTQRRFVGDASHELRTPLTTIRGNLGLLQRDPPIAEGDRVAVLADLVSESERLSRLVGDLLTLARSDAGRTLRREPVALRPLVAGLIRQLAVADPARPIGLEGPPDASALGDRDALTQVLLILLDNALKFTPRDGAVTVAIAAHGARASVTVRDAGPGIAPDALPHIFERFYQADAARAGIGTGLGLAIAQALVVGQGGMIAVESAVGRGSAFTVTLPRAPAETDLPRATDATDATDAADAADAAKPGHGHGHARGERCAG